MASFFAGVQHASDRVGETRNSLNSRGCRSTVLTVIWNGFRIDTLQSKKCGDYQMNIPDYDSFNNAEAVNRWTLSLRVDEVR